MDKKFIKIAVTVDYFYPDEAADITRALVEGGYDYVHIRKPGYNSQQIKSLINKIDPTLRKRITLHDHFEVAEETGIGGIHLNQRNNSVPVNWRGRLSRSCHSPEECECADKYDYVTLSPIYPSISKPGYKRCFDSTALHDLLQSGRRIIALGGVKQEQLSRLKEAGFHGAAMLSDAWRRRINPEKFCLQFITNPHSETDAIEQATAALAGGCRWIQLRWKDGNEDELLSAAKVISQLCKEHEAIFLLDDKVELVEKSGADGVHLGKNDIPVKEARRLLGPNKIIGASANTPEDIMAAASAGADYIGYGPFRFTSTKKNLSPILGFEGYRLANEYCNVNSISLPIVAIGGIIPQDIKELMSTGINGIAVSGCIINAADREDMTGTIIKTIRESIK